MFFFHRKPKGIGERVRSIIKKYPKRSLVIVGLVVLFLSAGTMLALRDWATGAQAAEADTQRWKGFEEPAYGFSMRYPSNWEINYNYDRFAKGLMDVGLTNNKNKGALGCGNDYIDLRIFVGYPPAGGTESDQDLKNQLYREVELIKSSGNADLVEALDINGQRVYRVKSEEPTFSLNGKCGGPLYLIDGGNGAFIYVFAGMGEKAKTAGEEIVKQIIISMAVSPAMGAIEP